jgi:hypothetical protein
MNQHPFTRANSLPPGDAAKLMLRSTAALRAARVGVQAWRVASVVFDLTVPYDKGWEALFTERLCGLTGMDYRAVRRGIKACHEAGGIEWEPSRWIPPKGQPGRPSLIGLPGASKAGSNRPPLSPREGQIDPLLEPSKAGSNRPYITVLRHKAHEGARRGLEGREGWQAERPDAEPTPGFLDSLTRAEPDELLRLAVDSTPAEAAAIRRELEGRRAAPGTPREWR